MMPAPLPPTFGLTMSGKTSDSAARGSESIELTTCVRAREAAAAPAFDLPRLARLQPINSLPLMVAIPRPRPTQEIVRVEDRAAAPALPRRGAHAIEERGQARRRFGWIEEVIVAGEADVFGAAAVELREQRFEPVGVFVKDSEGASSLMSASPFRCTAATRTSNKKPAAARRAGFLV